MPDAISDEAAPLIEPLAVATHDVSRADVKAGDTVVVFGGGPIGSPIALVCRPALCVTVSAATSLYLSLLFVVVYGATGWLTSLRGDVATWSFEWERNLPLVPWLIVPYMSLDLFFVAAPFLCADPAELRAFRRRMTTAILVAGAVFMVMPLQFAFPGRNRLDGRADLRSAAQLRPPLQHVSLVAHCHLDDSRRHLRSSHPR